MAIKYEIAFEYTNTEAENLGTGIRALAAEIKLLSMPETRRLVCTHVEGSYALLSEVLSAGHSSTISLTKKHADIVLSVAGELAAKLDRTERRRLRTWFKPLINDMKSCAGELNKEKGIVQPKPVADAPQSEGRSRKAAG